MNLFNRRMLAKVPRAMTSSFPLLEPYELKSRGANLKEKTKWCEIYYQSLQYQSTCIFWNWIESAFCKISLRCLGSWCHQVYLHGSVQDCSNSIANALELLQSCTKPSTWYWLCEVALFWFSLKMSFNDVMFQSPGIVQNAESCYASKNNSSQKELITSADTHLRAAR